MTARFGYFVEQLDKTDFGNTDLKREKRSENGRALDWWAQSYTCPYNQT